MLLQYTHIIFLPHDAIYFVKCTSPSCSQAAPQHDAGRAGVRGEGGVGRLGGGPQAKDHPPNPAAGGGVGGALLQEGLVHFTK